MSLHPIFQNIIRAHGLEPPEQVNCAKCSRKITDPDDDDCYRRTSPEDKEPFCETCLAKMDAEQEAEMRAAYAEWLIAPLSERDPEEYRRQLIDAGRGHLVREP